MVTFKSKCIGVGMEAADGDAFPWARLELIHRSRPNIRFHPTWIVRGLRSLTGEPMLIIVVS
ncbi:hypothetical protein CSV78_11670 [Sporosarcina sp. P16a]|nr:hypothetical protein CSV78_11670 [Sporosarcina sp. P16a]PIC91801.1 hypothetical protein CSV70_14090 [Sporosarcina sp. P25]